jgi:homoserine dehydrogenase
LNTADRKGIAILGCGTVGGAVAKILLDDIEFLQKRTNINLFLKYIIGVTFSHAKKIGLDSRFFTRDLDSVLSDNEVIIVVELMGGITTAREYAKKILKAGKHLVTANKALLAHHGVELFSLARENNVTVSFEASCGGGIPVIRALYDGLIANKNEALYGIVNGTCNYILTEMTSNGTTYSQALKGAQEKGLAEADPTLDVSGMDSAHKLTILSSIAFGMQVNLDSIPVSGIDNLDLFDVAAGKELGYIIKLIAMAKISDGKLSLKVAPSFISTEHPLAWISGSFNAISIYSHAVGHTMYYGRGAGGSPTASAIISDIISVLLGTAKNIFETLPIWPDITDPAVMLPPGEESGRYYIRINVKDQPGVLAKIASAFGQHSISISSVLQKRNGEYSIDNYVPIIITTHVAKEGDIGRAMTEIDSFDFVKGKSVYLNIIDEHEETL